MTEYVRYEVLKKLDNIEIRKYPELLFAVTDNNDEDEGFGFLFRYITGENKIKSKIKMTAPVITSEKIKMTAPVITRNSYMAFILPYSYKKETVPTPTNPNVKIEVTPEKTIAVRRFSGRTPETKVKKFMKELISTLNAHKIETKGEPILMRYNSPFTPGFLRRNEVGVEINEKKYL